MSLLSWGMWNGLLGKLSINGILLRISQPHMPYLQMMLLSLGRVLLPVWGVPLDSECAQPALDFLFVR